MKTVAISLRVHPVAGILGSLERATDHESLHLRWRWRRPASSIRTTIEENRENRGLEVVAASANYFRSSEISLDGDRAPRINELVFRGSPDATKISATLIGEQGKRARTSQWFQAAPAAGQ